MTGGGYEAVAVPLLAALTGAGPARLILDVQNRGAVAGLDDSAVVEVPCLVDTNGAEPLAVGEVPSDRLAAMSRLKAVERLVIEAARTGSRRTAVAAFAAHPLVGAASAEKLLAGYVAASPELAAALPNE